MLTYSSAELLLLRPAASTINRTTRKILFAHRLWVPSRFRFRVVRSLTVTTAVAKPVLNSGLHSLCPKRLDRRSVVALCLNVHSARNKSASIQELIVSNDADIFAVTETWHACSDDVALRRIVPPGYRCLEAARPARLATRSTVDNNNLGGGVALIYRDNLKAKRLKFDCAPVTFEYVASTLSSAAARIVFVVVYRPGSQPVRDQFFTELTSVLEAIALYSCDVVLTGDFNIHVDDDADTHAVRLADVLQSFGLVQSVVGPTHVGGRTLDLVITRSDRPRPKIDVDLPQVSDHSLVRFQLPIQRPPIQHVDVETRHWKGFDAASFRADLLASSLCCSFDSYDGLSVDELQEIYDSTLSQLLDKYVPKRTIRRRYQPMTPWFDSDCAAARRRTRLSERIYRRSKAATDRVVWVDRVRQLHQLYAMKQNTYWERKVAESQGNPRRLWKTLDAVLCKSQLRSTPPVDGLTADGFLNAFEAKVESVRASTASAAPPVFVGEGCTMTFDMFHFIDASYIERLVRQAPNKNCALDPVPIWLVKQFAVET